MFRSAVAVLFTSVVLAGCQANVPATDKAGEDGTAARAVASGSVADNGASAATETSASAPNETSQAMATGNVPAGTDSSSAPASGPAPAVAPPGAGLAMPAAATAFSGDGQKAPAAGVAGAKVGLEHPQPTFKLVTVPAGTTLNVTLSNAVGSDTSHIEDAVRGTISSDVVVDGLTAIPAGSQISGSVTDAQRSGRVKGRASVAFRFDRLEVRDDTSRIETSSVAREADASTKDDVKKGGIGAGIGAVVGGIAGGKKGAVIGAGVGGAGTVAATRGQEVHLTAGSRVRVTLRDSLDVRVPIG